MRTRKLGITGSILGVVATVALGAPVAQADPAGSSSYDNTVMGTTPWSGYVPSIGTWESNCRYTHSDFRDINVRVTNWSGNRDLKIRAVRCKNDKPTNNVIGNGYKIFPENTNDVKVVAWNVKNGVNFALEVTDRRGRLGGFHVGGRVSA